MCQIATLFWIFPSGIALVLGWVFRMAWVERPNAGWRFVPYRQTHAMERAYFTAQLPEFKHGISSTQRHKRNRMKMEARWQAMLDAAPNDNI